MPGSARNCGVAMMGRSAIFAALAGCALVGYNSVDVVLSPGGEIATPAAALERVRRLVKRLPRERLLPVLRLSKGTLQTAGLICPEEERRTLADLLIRAGVNRVTRAGHMSDTFPGEAHDGEYPLRRYVRAVDEEL